MVYQESRKWKKVKLFRVPDEKEKGEEEEEEEEEGGGYEYLGKKL